MRCRDELPGDREAMLACRRAGADPGLASLKITTDVLTNLGRIRVTEAGTGDAIVRSSGAIERATLGFSPGNTSSCPMWVKVAAEDSEASALAVTAVGIRGPCSVGGTSDFRSDSPEVIGGTFSLMPRTRCAGADGSLCVYGTFMLEITGLVPAVRGQISLAFVGPIGFEGTICSTPP